MDRALQLMPREALQSHHLQATISNPEPTKIILPRPTSLCHLQVVAAGPLGTDLLFSSSREARTRNWRAWSSLQSGSMKPIQLSGERWHPDRKAITWLLL